MDKSIRLQRTESVLKELLQESLFCLNDTRLNSLSILKVNCSKGKYHAEVFIHTDFYNLAEQKQILASLKKAEGILKEYILSASGWFKCPKLNFCFDDSLKNAKNLDELFAQIAKNNKEGKTND